MEEVFSTEESIPGQRKLPGRPTKKIKEIVKRLFDGIKRGVSYAMACELAGISTETFYKWRNDPVFNAEVLRLTRESVFELLDTIKEASHQSWQSAAFLLERRWPRDFGRAEAQLNFALAIQNNVNTQGANGHNFESVIVSDLEFLGLRKHENYSHRPHEKPARDVESTVMPNVPEDLSGTLVTQNHPGCSVVSQSQAEENARRVERANAAIDAAFKAKRGGNGNGSRAPGLPEQANSAMQLAPITLPIGEPSQAWWSGFTQGSNDRQAQKAAAIFVCRTILREVAGPLVAQNTPIDFESELVELRDVHSAIQDLVGPKGWSALLRKAGRE